MCKPAQCRPDGNALKKKYSDDQIYLDKNGEWVYKQIPLPNGGTADCACEPKGGYTHGEHSIEFASLWPKFTSHGSYWQNMRKVNNIIHELGHAFNQRAGQAPQYSVSSHSEYLTVDGKSELFNMSSRPKGFYSNGPGTMTWVQSIEVSGSEVFADMFIGWVYDKWASDPYGDARAKFMSNRMPGWVATSVRKP